MSERLPPSAVRRLLDAAASAPDDAPTPERYEIVREIGRGGMGVVYEAHDTELNRRVALKILSEAAAPSESARLRFLREARAAARLSHPHIATVYDATPESIAMQLVHGETLADVQLEARELAAVVRDAALAIHFAHGEGIVHRDLKPANLMVERRDTGDARNRLHVYVTDFGLAAEREVDPHLSASGGIVGTPSYMAPEQARGERDAIGATTDVYGLGATLFHGLARRPPFEAENLFETLEQVLHTEPPDLAQLVPGVERDLAIVVAKCMQKEPERRYPSTLALASDLERWLSGEPIQARPPSVGYRLRRFVSRRQGVFVAGLVAAGVVALVALPLLWRAHTQRVEAQRARAAANRAAEDQQRVFSLSTDVVHALEVARGSKSAGAGLETRAFDVLNGAIAKCRAFLAAGEDAHAYFYLGKLLREGERLDEALAALDRAFELDPSVVGLTRERGLVLATLFRERHPIFRDEEWTDEVRAYRARGAADLARSIDLDSEAWTADELYARAVWHWLEGDESLALQELKAVTEMDPTHVEAHRSLARIHTLRDELQLALHHSSIASDLFGGNRVAYVPRSGARTTEGAVVRLESEVLALEGLPELLIDFDLRMQTAPSNANNHGFRGQSQLRRALRGLQRGARLEAFQTLERALEEFTSTVELDPRAAAPRLNRAVCHALLDRVLSDAGEGRRAGEARRAAAQDYAAAIALEPGLGAAYYDLALLDRREATFQRLALDRQAAEARMERARANVRRALELLATHVQRARVEELAAAIAGS